MLKIFLTVFLVSFAGTLYLVHAADMVTAPVHDQDAANGTTAISLDITGSNARSGAIDTRLRWPGGVVNYRVSNDFINIEIAVIEQDIADIKSKTCITLNSSSTGRDYVYVTGQNTGCHSYVGRLGGRQELNLQRNSCIHPYILKRQFIHAIGFYNEHQRPDRDEYVTIQWQNIQPGDEHNFEKYGSNVVSTFNVPYDYQSIMHFPEYAYSKNGQKSIVAKDPKAVLGGKTISCLDVQKNHNMYAGICPGTAPAGK